MNEKYRHRTLNRVGVYTEQCSELEKRSHVNSDEIFLDFGGNVLLVTKSLCDPVDDKEEK